MGCDGAILRAVLRLAGASPADSTNTARDGSLSRLLIGVCLATWLLVSWEATSAQINPIPPPPPRARPKVSQVYLSRLVRQLGAPEYSQREEATERLIGLGAPSVPMLERAALAGGPEATTRAIAILETLYLTGDDETSDAAEEALERLADSEKQEAAARATEVLLSNQRFRERRALQRIVELGGVVKDVLGEVLDVRDPTALGREIPILQLGLAWRGGDDGLRHVKRLRSLQVLYVITGCGVSDKALEELRRALPNLKSIERRGPAYFGVGGTQHEQGCVITSVRADSAAARAGIAQGDVLLEFDGKKVKTFRDLVELIGQKKPGDRVKVLLRREGQLKTVEVVLDAWK